MESLTADDPQAIGGFRLQARLGAGAMGRVYLAASPAGRMVAVKVLRPELARDQEFIRRFRAEVDSARLVSRIYTAPVVAAGVDDVPPWLATAFVPGPSLDDVISRFGPLPVTALWRLAAGLAEALRAIHAVGLVHRDLKPGNVLLAYDGPRVIDFGISRATAEGRLTRTGPVVGTMGYLSPEQAQGHVAEPPSDVFSLGCVLAFAATGASPFSVGADALPAAVVYRVVQEEPDLGPVPVQFRRLIQACLAKDPALRPDPGRVAARCAVATEQLGLPPASFWPSDFADIIGAQQTALTAELQVLHVPPSPAPAAGRRQATRVPHRCWSHRGDRWRKRGRVGARLEYVAAAGQGHRQPRTKGPGHAGLDLPDKPGGERQPGGGERRRLPRQRGRRALRRRCHDGARTLVVARQLGHCRPTLTNGILCVSAAQGDFYAVQAATGTLAWDLSGNKLDPFARNWAANGAHVAVAIGDQTVRMYKATDGKSRWIATTSDESGFGQLVAASGDAVYAVGAHGALYALQASTGHEVYRVQGAAQRRRASHQLGHERRHPLPGRQERAVVRAAPGQREGQMGGPAG